MSQSLLKIVADFTVQLSSSVAIGDTTATLSSATDDDSVSLPSGLYGFTVDNGQSNKEYIVCSLSGTALTDIKSISRQGVQTTGFTKAHRRGAKVSITDWAILDRMLKNLNGTTGFDSSVNLGYDGTPTGLTGNQFATVNYVLSVVNGGTITFDKQVIDNQTAGENLTANDIIYFKESDQKWYKADADLTTTFDQLQIGIAQSTVLTGATVQVAISGPVSGFTGLTAGSKYYLSNTAGAITTTAGTYSVFIGWALSTTSLLFNPVLKTLPTQKEKDALAGSTGIPSSTNKYVTQDNTSSATTDQTQLTQNSSVEVGEANATTKKNKIAQSFIPTRSKIRGVNLYKSADLGTFTGTVTVSIQADVSGSPSGSALATKTITNLQWLALPVGAFETLFTSEYGSLTIGSLYWIVIETSTSDNSNHPNIGTNTAGGYSNGSVKFNNSTDNWTAVATIDLYFSTMEGNASQGVTTDASGKIPLAFFDIKKMPKPAFYQEFSLSLNASTTGGVLASTASSDGNNIYIVTYNDSNRLLLRYTKDLVTGIYTLTHSATITGSAVPTTYTSGLVVIGNYVYLLYDGGTNAACYRYLATDLTGETTMTVPTVAVTANSKIISWTDGTYMYFVVPGDSLTSYKWSVSGTIFSAVSTATATSSINGNCSSSIFDGTSTYIFSAGAGLITIAKLTNINGSTATLTQINFGKFGPGELAASGQDNPPVIAAPIDSDRMYIGFNSNLYNATVQTAVITRLFPVTKP